LNIPTTRKIRYILRNQAKLKLKLNAFGRLTENLSDLSSKGIAFQMRVPEKSNKIELNKAEQMKTIKLYIFTREVRVTYVSFFSTQY